MTPAQQKTSDGRKNSLVRFLAGLGVGLAAGWSAWLFRRRSHSRPNTAIAGEPTAASHEAAIAKSDVLEEATAQGSGRIDDPEQITNSPVAPTPDNASTSQPAATLDEASFDNVEDSEPQPHPAGNEVFDPPSDSHQIDDVPKAAIEDSSGAGPEASVELPGIEAPQSAPAFEEDEHPNTQPMSLSDASEADGVSPPPSNVNAAHEPTIRRPRAAESTTEYGTSIGHLLPVEYLRWNRWLIEHAIATSQANEEIYLSITPTILAGVAADQGGALASPEDAEAQFVAALRNAYAIIIAHNGRLRLLRTFDADGRPLSPAFLALSVLAAYRMQTDEEISGRAYYMRLAELLGCEMTTGHPEGFDPVVFESLWLFTAKWIAEKTGVRLAMPGEDIGVRRFIALPLTHVPLRRLDIEKLPAFFVWAEYAPGAKVPMARLSSDLLRWARGYASLSSAGSAALGDERRPAVMSQVALELEAWDGSITESSGRRSASVELMLDIVRFQPDLFYLPRRPEGFPAHFEDGGRVLDAGEDGWYAPLQLSANDGGELSSGFEWTSSDNVSLRRSPVALVPLGPSPDYTGFLSRPNLLRGTPCAVLCEERIVQAAGDYLRAGTGRPCPPIIHPNLPAGWRLFPNVKLHHRVDVPDGLDALGLASEAEIVFTGGLRLGRRREWLAGAPPKIIVSGLDANEPARVDGLVVPIDDDGVLQTNGQLLGPGTHFIDAGPVQRIIEIVEPHIECAVQSNGFDTAARYAALPPGLWYLVGAVPGQITPRIDAGRSGRVCKADFDPVWAISVGAGPGAILISIKAVPLAANTSERRWNSTARVIQWASIIYGAAIRRPRVGSLAPHSDLTVIDVIWKGYVRTVRELKRRGRRR